MLQFDGVSKAFGKVYALRDVTFQVNKGECLALVGENGAGKSTLMKILSGVWPTGTYEGDVYFQGEKIRLNDPLDARRIGISIIHQELCLFPELTAAENIFLTEEAPYDGEPSQRMWTTVSWKALNEKAQALFDELGFEVDATAKVGDLSVAKQQLVEIARAVHHEAKVLILDEPTSALSGKEVDQLFAVINRMRQRNVTFIYITHKLDEVFTLADRIVVLRDGQAVATLEPERTDEKEVIKEMVGRPLTEGRAIGEAAPADPILEVSHYGHETNDGKPVLQDISFSLAPGEVLGVAGLMGAGRSELLRSLVGVLPGRRTGSVLYEGRKVEWHNISEALDAGVSFVTEDRKADGLFLDHGVGFNLTITVLDDLVTNGMVDKHEEDKVVEKLIRRLGVKCGAASDPVRTLSGGNQQKVLLAKMLARSPRVLLLDEPTRGIDVGAKEEIYRLIGELAAEGLAILLVSSELPEILSLSHRVMVLREGRLMGEMVNRDLTQEAVMSYAAGSERGESHGLAN